jgi:hypothetical protein
MFSVEYRRKCLRRRETGGHKSGVHPDKRTALVGAGLWEHMSERSYWRVPSAMEIEPEKFALHAK